MEDKESLGRKEEENKGNRGYFEVRKVCFGRKTLLWPVMVNLRSIYIKLRFGVR